MTSPGIVCPSPVYSKPSPSCCPQSSLLYPQMTYPDALSCYPYSLMYNNLFMLQAAYSTPNKTSIRNYLPSYHDSSPILDLSARANSCSSPEVSSDDSFVSGMIFFLIIIKFVDTLLLIFSKSIICEWGDLKALYSKGVIWPCTKNFTNIQRFRIRCLRCKIVMPARREDKR